ncbi:MAG: AI-2E family transporter [Patescibacteria group bacterium]|jgi:predicted PurR-regulated permease PerM|nr:AI-2E family transporter [Patescibacteria group bacterium]
MKLTSKDIIKVLILVTVFLLGLLLLYKIRGVLGVIAASFLVAILLNPLVGRIQKAMPKKSRISAILITVILLVLLFGFFGLIIFKPLIQEYGSIANEFNLYFNQARGNGLIQDAINQINGLSPDYKQIFASVGGTVGGIVLGILNGLFSLVTIIILSLFMLVSPQRITDTVASYIPTKHRKAFHDLSNALSSIVPKYFAGVLITAFILAVATYIPLLLLQIPYALALSAAMFIFGLIPLVGATLGMFFITLFCFMLGQPAAGIIFFIYILIYQQVENNLIVPLIQKKTVSLSPLSVLIAILIGSAAAGMVGALLAIPAAAMIKVAYSVLIKEGYLKEP